MKVALAMILRNEAFMLDSILSSVANQFPLVVAIDYGSSDGTQDILRKHKATFEERKWPDSFSVARNETMELAWRNGAEAVFFLDGDETVWPHEIGIILDLTKPSAFPRINLLPDKKRMNNSYPDHQARFVTKASGLVYRGAVHEHLHGHLNALSRPDIFHYSLCKPPRFVILKNHQYSLLASGQPSDWTVPVPIDAKISVDGIPYEGQIPIPIPTL